ncbi:hypothetical protein ABGB12_19565 [Actinocorallia sp. B10E7]|uniref:hypothetical protein n=1 Tax=Actinocorallia sp. B10E7 TaxID=3153558 RepID=UPI00325EEA52
MGDLLNAVVVGGASGLGWAIAQALAANGYAVTGEVLDVNGGAHLRRYPDLHTHVAKAFA